MAAGRYAARKAAGRRVVVTEFPDFLYDALRTRADDDEVPMSAFIRLAVREKLGIAPIVIEPEVDSASLH